VFTAMRYWNPMIRNVAQTVSSIGFDKIVLLPLYPHYSVTTTGSSFHEWQRYYQGDPKRLVYVEAYPEHSAYISALNDRINEAILSFPREVRKEIQLVFSAHGTPVSLVKKGDPYSRHIDQTVAKVMALRQYSHDFHLCFQSKVGPVKWLEPATETVIKELGRKNKKQILVIPVSFVSDHIETLHELEIEYREIANQAGIENYVVMKGLNDSVPFCAALKEIAIAALHQEAAQGRRI
jgi:protoporphyrin/coproporphyrin ferrochelatase